MNLIFQGVTLFYTIQSHLSILLQNWSESKASSKIQSKTLQRNITQILRFQVILHWKWSRKEVENADGNNHQFCTNVCYLHFQTMWNFMTRWNDVRKLRKRSNRQSRWTTLWVWSCNLHRLKKWSNLLFHSVVQVFKTSKPE